ncbi:MAG: hypothetical protein IV092_15950 [Burkholderiaceae bacterium]|nr:hypothetical protein [Burkholderiaceae bacterium]
MLMLATIRAPICRLAAVTATAVSGAELAQNREYDSRSGVIVGSKERRGKEKTP